MRIFVDLIFVVATIWLSVRAYLESGDILYATVILLSVGAAWKIVECLDILPKSKDPSNPRFDIEINKTLVLIFAVWSLYLSDEYYIKVQLTVASIAMVFLYLFMLIFGRDFKKQLGSSNRYLSEEKSKQVLGFVIVSWILLGIANEYTWRTWSTGEWASFRLFGVMAVVSLLDILPYVLLSKSKKDEAISTVRKTLGQEPDATSDK